MTEVSRQGGDSLIEIDSFSVPVDHAADDEGMPQPMNRWKRPALGFPAKLLAERNERHQDLPILQRCAMLGQEKSLCPGMLVVLVTLPGITLQGLSGRRMKRYDT